MEYRYISRIIKIRTAVERGKNMLSITRATNLSGTSEINGQTAMTMYAAIPNTGSSTINTTITNKELYLANQEQCDADY